MTLSRAQSVPVRLGHVVAGRDRYRLTQWRTLGTVAHAGSGRLGPLLAPGGGGVLVGRDCYAPRGGSRSVLLPPVVPGQSSRGGCCPVTWGGTACSQGPCGGGGGRAGAASLPFPSRHPPFGGAARPGAPAVMRGAGSVGAAPAGRRRRPPAARAPLAPAAGGVR